MKIAWYGYHTRDVPELSQQDKILSDKIFFAQGLLYNPVLGLVKWSIILFLIRLDDRRRYIRWTLIALQVFNVAHMVAVFLVVIFQCSPVNMYWNHHKTDELVEGKIVNDGYTCIDQASFSLSTAGISVLTDVAILLVPIAMMWNLRMPTRRKLAGIFVLSLGWVVAVVGVIRIKFFVDFWYGHFPDPSWSLWHTLSGVENNVAIMVACGPAIKAYITRFFPHLLGTFYPSRPTGNVYHTHGNHELASRAQTRASVAKPLDKYSSAASVDARCGKGDSTEAIVPHSNYEGSGDFAFGFGHDTASLGHSAHVCSTLNPDSGVHITRKD
jgi:hypothetical protein